MTDDTIYKLTSITNLDGTNRLDGRYPLRIGRTCRLFERPIVGQCLYIEWISNADGTPYPSRYTRTSLVRHVEWQYARAENAMDWQNVSRIIVTTCNSIYTFDAIFPHLT